MNTHEPSETENSQLASSGTPVMHWLKLLRITNLPSALANILLAYLLVQQSWLPMPPLLLLLAASASLYSAGMVLNDVFDFEIDQRERPNRVLPSGKIKRETARNVGWLLLLSGVVWGVLAGWVVSGSFEMAVRSGGIALLLAVTVYLYDGPCKRTPLAPVLMGSCRLLNILLGASVVVSPGWLGFSDAVWWVAAAIGCLIFGTTLLARKEAAEKQVRGPLLVAGFVILAAMVAIAFAPWTPFFNKSESLEMVFPLFVALIGFPIVRRTVTAVITLKATAVQGAVVSILRSLIVFDAAMCYLVMPHSPVYSLTVLALLIPSLLLGRRVAAT